MYIYAQKHVQSNLGLALSADSQKIALPNCVAGLIRSTSDVVSKAPVCAVCSIIESRGPSYHHTHVHTCVCVCVCVCDERSSGWLAHKLNCSNVCERKIRLHSHMYTEAHTHTHIPLTHTHMHTHLP